MYIIQFAFQASLTSIIIIQFHACTKLVWHVKLYDYDLSFRKTWLNSKLYHSSLKSSLRDTQKFCNTTPLQSSFAQQFDSFLSDVVSRSSTLPPVLGKSEITFLTSLVGQVSVTSASLSSFLSIATIKSSYQVKSLTKNLSLYFHPQLPSLFLQCSDSIGSPIALKSSASTSVAMVHINYIILDTRQYTTTDGILWQSLTVSDPVPLTENTGENLDHRAQQQNSY